MTTELPSDRNDFKGEATIVKSMSRQHRCRQVQRDRHQGDRGPAGWRSAQRAQHRRSKCGVRRLQRSGRSAALRRLSERAHAEPLLRRRRCLHPRLLRSTAKCNSVLTLVPCENNFLLQAPSNVTITVQFLVFNEFEQRFSTSTKVNCYKEVRLSDIDNRPGPEGDAASIFSVGVQGTVTGMSRLRSVPGANVDGYDGRNILTLLTENWDSGICADDSRQPGRAASPPSRSTTALHEQRRMPPGNLPGPSTSTAEANVQFQGSRLQGDRMAHPADLVQPHRCLRRPGGAIPRAFSFPATAYFGGESASLPPPAEGSMHVRPAWRAPPRRRRGAGAVGEASVSSRLSTLVYALRRPGLPRFCATPHARAGGDESAAPPSGRILGRTRFSTGWRFPHAGQIAGRRLADRGTQSPARVNWA